MTEAIGQILGNAVGVALSPMPEIAVVLMLFSLTPLRNSLSFLAGWLLGLTGVALLTLALGIGSGADSDSGGIVATLIGALFIALAIRQWRRRPGEGEHPEMPSWMKAVDHFSAARAFALALALSALNPKNFGLTVAAGVSITGADLTSEQELAVMLIFVGLASTTIIATIAFYVLARERAQSTLESIRLWLIANNDTVMTILFAVIGAKVLGDGLIALSG